MINSNFLFQYLRLIKEIDYGEVFAKNIIDVRFHYLKDHITSEKVDVKYVKIQDQVKYILQRYNHTIHQGSDGIGKYIARVTVRGSWFEPQLLERH